MEFSPAWELALDGGILLRCAPRKALDGRYTARLVVVNTLRDPPKEFTVPLSTGERFDSERDAAVAVVEIGRKWVRDFPDLAA
jgi:hypothetical protein